MTSTPPAVGTMTDKYDVVSNIGRGSFGIITKVKRRSDNKILCRKEINYLKMSTKEREQLQAEINILSSLRHPNIVSYYHREHIKSTNDLHLYMEYCGGGDLSKTIQDLAARKTIADEGFVWSIFSQLVSALYRCHYGVDPPAVPDNVMSGPQSAGLRRKDQWTIMHRDLKPENIFLGDDDSVKLGDFGLSKQIQGNDFASTYVGTPYYMSPEICAGERYTSKSDIWSVGCIIYELCTTQPPFDAKTHIELIQKIRHGIYKPIPSAYSMELHNLIQSCLKVNPQKRPSTHDLVDMVPVRMCRKEREVLEINRTLKAKLAETDQVRLEAEQLVQKFEVDKQKIRQEIDDSLRRQWEVKAAMAIDEKVKEARAQLQKEFHKEWENQFPARVAVEVEKRMAEYRAWYDAQQRQKLVQAQRSTSPVSVPSTSVYSSQTTNDDFNTDISSLTIDSPFKEPVKPLAVVAKKRTPFGRDKSRTQVDSDMDVTMDSPSPASVNALSLSPRRGGRAALNSTNLFGKMNGTHRLQSFPTSPSLCENDRPNLDLSASFSDSEDDVVAPLPSPTLNRTIVNPATHGPRPGRPSLARQTTAPTARLGEHSGAPTLFKKNNISSTQEEPGQGQQHSTSPTRERRANASGLKNAKTEGDMHRDVVRRNAGRTLVELQQEQMANRTAGAVVNTAMAAQNELILPPKQGSGDKENAGIGSCLEDVAVWDPDVEMEMPSPFLVRTKGRGFLPVR